MLKQLIHGDWETHEVLTADAEGFVSFTGFKGNYTLQAEAGNAGFTLNNNLCETLILKA